MPIPDAILNSPTLTLGLGMYWEAFWELCSDRAIGMMEGPIPWRAIRLYGKDYGLESLDLKRFHTIIRGMDNEYCSIRSKEAEKKKANG